MQSKFKGIFWQGDIEENFVGHIAAEIFKDRIYDPYFIGKKDLTVIDCGANTGCFSLYASKYAKQIYALEPAQEHFETISFMIDFNGLINVKPFKVALSNTDGESTFYHIANNKTMYSLNPAVLSNDIEKVKTIQIGTFLKENNIEKVDFLKLDCEGSEADIVCSTSFQENAHKIDTIVCEIHSWMGRDRNQLIDGFKMAGFTRIDKIPNEADIIVCQK